MSAGAAALLAALMPLSLHAQVPAAPSAAAAASSADAAPPSSENAEPADAASAPAASAAPEAPASAAAQEQRARRAAARAARNAPMRANWQLVINAPDRLRNLLARYLDVARFRSELASQTTSLAELGRLVAVAPAQARSLLETEGYFNAQVTAQLITDTALLPAAAEPSDAAQDADERPVAGAGVPVVRIDVVPGPIARVARSTVEVQGELQTRAAAGDDAARRLISVLGDEWPLSPGHEFRQADWTAAKNGALARLRAEPYPLANWSGTSAQVDPATNRVRIFAVADSGPHFSFGPLHIEGLARYDASAVTNLAPFGSGMAYSEKALLDFQERIAKTGLFDGVSVSVEPEAANADALPVQVRLRELPAQQASVGVGISTDNGPRVTLEHLHRRVFGWNWQAKTKIELGRFKKLLQTDFTSHAQPGGYRNLFSAGVSRELANNVTIDLQKLRLGRTQDTERIERLYYLEWQQADTQTNGVLSGAAAATGNYEWIWRALDSNLLPTRGLAASAKVGAGRSFLAHGVNGESNGWFSRATGRITWYQPLGGQWYSQLRAEGGQVFARDNVAVPYTLLFRAGGDNSVRGYAYQSLGPVPDASGVAIGGRVMATGSVELAHPLSPSLPAWWGAVFVDAGNAAARWVDFSPAWGYGVGVRWRSPVGPLSFDIAYGEQVRRFRLHFNVGVTF